MAAGNLDSAQLKGIADGGIIHEDVLDKIFDISRIPLPFSDLIGRDDVSNAYTEWTQDRLQAQDLTNAVVDGADTSDNDESIDNNKRVGNHCQISRKTINVSSRADASNTIGYARTLAYQVMMRQQELLRDEEGIMMTGQASLADDGNTAAGTLGGFQAWLATNNLNGTTAGYGGTSAGIVDAHAPGLQQDFTETAVRNMITQVWEGGGSVSVMMSIPSIIAAWNQYLFTSSARIATLEGKTSADGGRAGLTAKGYVNVFLSDHGEAVEIRANRLQPTYKDSGGTADVAAIFFIDPSMVRKGVLRGRRVERLAKQGLSERRQISEDYTLKVLNEEAHGVISDIKVAPTVTA